MLECGDGSYYTGFTTDVERRVKTHNAGKGAKYTKTRLPVKVIHTEEFATKEEAMSREWHIKHDLIREQKEELIAMGNVDRSLRPGDRVQHFKRETVDPNTTEYLYQSIGKAYHSETKEPLMIDQALYDDYALYARPYDMFLSEVDREKYPDIKQKYRFEIISD
ncbi:MAG: DUF1653 domain-containing protein [Clostridia bacterium]|nr:DUF1653 domain-containing protein [Clostridia bacterium]